MTQTNAGKNITSWLPAASIGTLAGIDNIAASLAIASLLFAGPLSAGLGLGVGVVMVSGTILAIVVALRSTLPNSVALVQESTVAIMAAAIITTTARLSGPTDVKIATSLALLGASTVTTGALFWIMGHLKLGGLIRFLPYPVVAGFLAGSGWLLVDGSVMMVTGGHIGLHLFQELRNPATIYVIVPALAFAILLSILVSHFSHPMTITLAMAFAAAAFFSVLATIGITVEDARALGYFPELTLHGGVEFPTVALLGKIDWHALLTAVPMIGAVAIIAMVGMLLNLSGLEVVCRRDIDANAELRSSGLANLLAGATGGPLGFVSLNMTILAERTGVHGRSAGISTAIAMILGLVAAGSFIFEIPVFLAAGFVMFMGFGLLRHWAVATYKQLPLSDWIIVVTILILIAAVGFLQGLAFGIAVSIALFVFNYARLPIVRANGSGLDYRSAVDRSPSASRLLSDKADAIEIIRLQGYLFFGSADGIVKHVRDRLADRNKAALRFLIIDFRHVSGLDSAATSGFVKIRRMCQDHSVTLFLTHLPEDAQQSFLRAGIRFGEDETIRISEDTDHALEQAEEAILLEERERGELDVTDQFAALVGPHPRLDDLLAAMTQVNAAPGDRIIAAGDEADDLYFLARGRLRIEVTLPNGRRLRLRTMAGGAFVGEIGFFARQKRTADVIVEAPSDIYRLDADKLSRLEAEDPEVALLAHRLIATNLCEKLTVANQTIKRSEH